MTTEAQRRNIAPEFRAAVAACFPPHAVSMVADIVKELWTSRQITVVANGMARIIDNPHFGGKNIEGIAATLKGLNK